MKKILVIALAIAASMQFAGAQSKSLDGAASAIKAAQEATANPKKAAKSATWMKLAKAYVDSYNLSAGDGWINASKQELAMLGLAKPKKSETIEVNGQTFEKQIFENCEYYFNAQGALAAINVTKTACEDPLGKALEAYKKAYEVNSGVKLDDVVSGIKTVYEKYSNEAFNAYTLGDIATASKKFEAAARASMVEPFAKPDTSSLYNAGFTAWAQGEGPRAKALFQECLSYGFESENGEIYAKLADICDKEGNKEDMKNYLEMGFVKYPQSQSILIGLINYYMTNEKNTDRLFELLNNAKVNEPNNASLYYVEGNINSELGKYEEAVAAYEKCVEINPNYEYGYVGEGVMFYQKAVADQTAAQEELDDAKYMELVKQFEADLKACIPAFEKAFELTKDNDLKVNIAEYLKNAYYRFSSEDEASAEAYKKYDKICKEGLN